MAEVAALGLRVDGVSNINQAEKSLDGFAASANKADKSTGQFGKTASGLKNPLSSLNNSLSSAAKSMLALGAATMSLAAVSRTLMGFEESMSQVAAITRANTKELQAMRDMAKQLGATTKFSASEAADGIKFLGMAGFNASQSLASIPAVLNLATASAMGLSDAADIATNIMSGFGIAAENAANVADVLAAASSRSNTSVQQLGGAMSTVAPISAALGISLEDTAAAIGTLSDAGIQGERAGTAMRGALAALAGPTTQAQQVLSRLGLTVAEVNPQTNELSVVFGRLRDAGLSTADAMTIFGREAASGALVLTGAAQRVGEFGQELQGAAGEAQRMADIMADNLGGDFKNLQSIIEALIIAMGEAGLTAIMRGAVQLATDLVGAAVNLVNQFGRVTNFIGSALSPAFNVIGHILTTLAKNADAFVIALAGMYAPAVMVGIKSLTSALAVGLVGAIKAVTAAMMANPVGWLIRALAVAGAAVYAFREDIQRWIGIDVVQTFKNMALGAAGALDQMAGWYTGYVAALWASFKTLGANIVIAFENAFEKAKELFSDLVMFIQRGLPGFAKDFTPFVGAPQEYLSIAGAAKEAFEANQMLLGARDALVRSFADDSIWEVGTKAFEDYTAAANGLAGTGEGGGGGGLPAATDALRKWLDEARIATAGARTMTEAYLAGGEAISALSRQVDIENAVLEHGAAARDAITNAINNQQAALDRLDIAKQINDLREQVKQSQGLVVVLGEQSKGYQQGQRAMAAYNREQQINNLLVGKNAEEVADLIELYRELWDQSDALAQTIDANNELNRLVESTRTAQERYNAELQRLVSLRPYAQTAEQAEALNRAIDDIQRKNSEWIAFTEDALERMNSAFADMWRDAFDGSKNLFDGMKKGFRQMLAEMAHAAITQPIMISVGNALMGTNNPGGIGSGGGIFGALNTARSGMTAGSSLGNAAQWLGQKIGSEALTSFGLGLSGTTAATGIASIGAGLGASLGTTIGTSAAAMTTTTFSAALGGGAAAGGAAAGGAAWAAGIGSAVGAALPWIGGALAIGSAFGLFDDRIPTTRRSQQGASHMLPDGSWEVSSWDDRQSVASQEAARDFAQAAVKHANELFNRIGVDAAIYSFQTLMESSILGDKQGVGSSGILRLGESLIDIGLAVEASWTRHGVGGWSEAEMLPRLMADVQLTLLEAFQAAGDELPRILSSILEGVDIRGLPVEEALALTEAFRQMVSQIELTQQALLNLPFDYLRDITFEATANLIEYAGGVQNLQSGIDSYFRNFHSIEEQLAYETKLLTEAFADVGLTLPDLTQGAQYAKDSFRDLVESLDVTTEEGQRGIATAYALSQRFADLADGMAGLSDVVDNTLRDAVAAGEAAFRALSNAVEKERSKIQAQAQRIGDALRESISVASQSVSELSSLTNRLTSTMQRMVSTGLDTGRNRAWAQGQLRAALASGAINQSQEFEHALQIVAQPSQGLFDNFEDYQADFLRSANDVAALSELAGVQLTTEQRALESLESQLAQNQQWYESEMARLDGILEYQRTRLDIAMGTYQAVLSIPDAIAQVTAAIGNIKIVQQNLAQPSGSSYYSAKLEQLKATGSTHGGINWSQATTRDLEDYFSAIGMTPEEHWKKYGRYEGLNFPGFAQGTNYLPFDVYGANLHEGERIIPKADNLEMIGLMRLGATRGNDFRLVQQELRETRLMLKTLMEEISDTSYEQLEELRRQGEVPQQVKVMGVVPTVAAVPGQ